MNANKRMKYASTPTYGMQKRGFSKKSASAQQPTTPDFTQFPTQDPMAAPFAQQGMAAFPPTLFHSGSDISQPPLIPQAAQPVPSHGGMAFQVQPFSMGGGNFSQPMPSAPMSAPMQQPLGSAPLVTPASMAQIGGFSPRQQGFTPPTAPLQNSPGPHAGPVNVQQPVFDSFAPAQYSPMGAVGGQVYPATRAAPYMPQATAPSLNPSLMNGASMNMNPLPSAMPMQQMPSYPPQQIMAKAPRQPIDRDKVWMSFLFGALPLLFIPCLLAGQTLDFLRYAFIALCVTGLGAMWYRQMFTSSTRMTVTIIYAALCIVTISILLNGNIPVQETSGNSALMQAQATPDPGSAAASTPSPAPEPTDAPISPLGESEAEQRLTMFMNLWAAQQRTEMVSYIQPSWASTKENPAAELFTTVLFNRIPLDHTIESITGTDADNSRTVTMSATIDKGNGKDPVLYRFMIVMNKESGEWYVDPNTLSTNDIIAEEEAIAAATQSALITLQPTMTVTPAPLASTLLYYNPDGGSYYHADPECPKVRKEYLPLEGSFPYSDLASYNKDLQPCLDCRAPTQTLE